MRGRVQQACCIVQVHQIVSAFAVKYEHACDVLRPSGQECRTLRLWIPFWESCVTAVHDVPGCVAKQCRMNLRKAFL
jgi:hypothetical protein